MNAKNFRKLGFIEGVSLLLLLFVAMPLKYKFGIPEAVSIVGMLHGLLFLAYALLGLFLKEELGWSYTKLGLAYIIASIPLGPFLLDSVLFPAEKNLT